jgi:hypothetical protein
MDATGTRVGVPMTESEWLTCDDPNAMIDHLERAGKDDHRKMRLFAVACCRRVLHVSSDVEARKAVDAAERYADGLIKGATLARWSCKADRLWFRVWPQSSVAERAGARLSVLSSARAASLPDVITHWRRVHNGVTWLVGGLAGPVESAAWSAATRDESRAQCRILRDLFGNPFRPVAVDPSRLAGGRAAVEIARGIYEGPAFDRLPVLADALAEGGCTDADAIAHCRSEEGHVRGGWVVDAVLGKT